MKLRVNNKANLGTKKVGVSIMEGGSSNVRQITASAPQKPAASPPQKPSAPPAKDTAHENNTIVLIASLVYRGYAFSRVVV